MKLQILIGTFCLALMVSCKKAETETSPVAPEAVVVPDNSVAKKMCYAFIQGKDTVSLSLVQNANNINGELDYHWSEKDRNRGTISGIFVGDTLIADYTFMSEGVSSVREVAFLKSGNTLIEGYGDVAQKDNKQVFKNMKSLKFEGSTILSSTTCD